MRNRYRCPRTYEGALWISALAGFMTGATVMGLVWMFWWVTG